MVSHKCERLPTIEKRLAAEEGSGVGAAGAGASSKHNFSRQNRKRCSPTNTFPAAEI